MVLADPDGNGFLRVIEAGNKFLAGTGFIGALACDGTQEVGYFWSEVLRWPLVWDQDQETAIQSPDGGTKITWVVLRLHPRSARTGCASSWRCPPAPTGRPRWTAISLGARCTDTGYGNASRAMMLDPDGNEFAVQILR
ncbi:VOC domain-containing protein OS=Streptomyces microflavus OX=1919 GN=Smic_79680 PE=4 SV=1 [Streptomyces microflavus]